MTIAVEDMTALVTGANRGIGKAFTETLLDTGAIKVYAAVRNLSSVDELVEKYGDRVVPIEYDLTKPETAAQAAKVATDVNLVVSNAGVLDVHDPLSVDAVESLKFLMEGNVYALIYLAQAFAPVLKANGGGALAQMNSLASLKNFTPFTTYSASKAAAYSVTQGLRDAFAEQGTQVISIMAGPIKTDMADSAGIGEGAASPEVVAEVLLNALQSGDFLAYPDPMAQGAGDVYESFAENVINANLLEEETAEAV